MQTDICGMHCCPRDGYGCGSGASLYVLAQCSSGCGANIASWLASVRLTVVFALSLRDWMQMYEGHSQVALRPKTTQQVSQVCLCDLCCMRWMAARLHAVRQ